MFDGLSRSMQQALKLASGNAALTESNIQQPLKEIKNALLEADVSLPVVRSFMKRVEQRALGQEVIVGVSPETALVKLVYDELVQLMGSAGARDLEPGAPQIVVMAGLQGVGKTTTCGKLASYLVKQGKSVLLVATDVYRPAAIEQLTKLGKKINVPVFEMGTSASPVEIARQGVEEGRRRGVDAILIDTAGRLQVDAELMQEIREVKAAVRPTDTLLVVDAMTGQEAANLVRTFNDELGITGAILTKMDGDSRGGAALCVREVSGQPIKFMGSGEDMDSLEPFYPERMATRVLGMGDILTLYERAKASSMQPEDQEALMKRVMEGKFDMNDFLQQWKAVNSMGGMQVMKLVPGFNQVSDRQLYEAGKNLAMYESMIAAMQEDERATPDLLLREVPRRRRVAAASGFSETQITSMVAQFNVMRSQMLKMAKAMVGGPGGKPDPKMMQEVMAGRGAGAPVGGQGAGGSAKRKDGGKAPPKPKDKTKGFGMAAKK